MDTDISTALATLQLDPDNAHALSALRGVRPGNGSGVDPATLARSLADSRRWHRERGDFELCVQLIDLQLTWTNDAATRAELLHEKGRILADELLSEEAARAAFREALQNVSNHPPSADDLAQMALIADNWRPISARYLQQAEAAAAGAGAGAGDRQLASSLFGSVAEMFLKYAPAEPEGEVHLRRSLALDPKNRRASFHFERLLRARNRPEELLSLLGDRATQAQSRDERALAEVNTAELSLELGKTDEAFLHFRKALDANPVEARALRPVVATLTERKDWPELGKVLEAAARSKRGESDATLLMQLAMLQWKKLGQATQAEIHFRKVRKLDPANRAMVEFYRELYGAKPEDLPQWLAVLTAAQKVEPDLERRVAMGIEMAHAAEARPQNAEKAIDIWKGLLRMRPHFPEAVQALRRLYVRTQKWNALLDLLKEDLETLPESARAERIERLLEVAEIYRDRLGLEVMVVNTYLAVLQIDPAHPQALAALAQRFEAQGRWNDLIQILGRQADLAVEPAQRLSIHRRIAGLWVDKLGKHQNAVASLEKILEAEPSDVETRERLRDLYVRSRSWRALVDLTRREAHLLAPAARRDRLAEAARISAERLGDSKEAINFWNLVLEVEPRDAEAMAGLAPLYEREHRWAALAEILDRQSVLAEREPATVVTLLERRGALLHEKLGAAEAAIAVFSRLQQLQPGNPRATRALREIYAQSGDFEALERLYGGSGNFEELCDALTTLADRTKDVGARARMLARVAVLASERLHQPERAIKAYERILTADPANLAAAEALVPLYRAGQKWPRLLAIYDVLLGSREAPRGEVAARLAILHDARQIAEQRMGSKGLAFQWTVRAHETAPSDEAVLGELERLAGDADEWGEIAALYAKRLGAAIAAPVERVALLRRLMRITTARLNRPTEARGYAEALLRELPGDAEAHGVLEQVLTQSQSWSALTALLHTRAEGTADKGERAKQLFRIAQLEEERSGDGESAARTLGSIVDLDAGTESTHRALRALARILEQRKDWPALVSTLRRELALRPVEDHEDILLRIAEIEEQKIGDLEATFTTLAGVLRANPYAAAAVAGLERLRERGFPRSVEMATLSLPAYQRSDNPGKLAAALEVLVDAPEGAAERQERLQRLVSLHAGPLEDPRRAYHWAREIFEANPAERASREALVRFASEVGALPEVASRLRTIAENTDDVGLRRDLLVEVAELHETKLGSADEAESVYREILRVEPLHAGAFRALSRLFRDSERWNELRGLLDARQAELADPSARLELFAQIAEIDETVLDEVGHAVATYEQMLELDSADPRAYTALDRHYAALGRWGDREQLLERRLRFASEGEVSELEFRRAESRFEHFGDVDGAIEILESIVRAHPEHEGARRLLEKALTLPENRLRAARVLEPLYEGTGAFKPLAAVLELQSQHLEGSALTGLLTRLASLYEHRLGDAAHALDTWKRVLAADGAYPQALTEIERLASQLQRWTELVDVYQEVAFRRDGADVGERADLLSRAARLYNDRLGNRRAAIDAWKMVINLDPQNETISRPAAEALERLYVETNNVPALIKILRQQVEWASDLGARPEGKLERLFRIADLEENAANDTDAAVATLRSVLEVDPTSAPALDRLEAIFERLQQPRSRIEILRRRIELATDVADRRELWRRVAAIFEHDASDPQEAIFANLAILDETPGDLVALDALASLYERQHRHAARLEILERRLALAPSREGVSRQELGERAEGLRRIAELLGGPLASPADALVRWRELLALAPADPGALEALEHLLGAGVDPGLRLSAAEALEATYEATGRFPELAGVLQIYVDSESDPRTRVGTLVRLARLQEERLGDRAAAFESYTQALRDALAEPRLSALLDAYERLAGAERGKDVIALYREIAPDVLDETIKQRLDRRIAEGALALGDTALAAESYRRVLERQPDDAQALDALERIYRQSDDAAALYEILGRRAEIGSDAAAERKVRLQLGQLAETLGRPEEAIAAYERVFELSRESTEAIEALDRLYAGAERWSDLLALLERQLDRRLPESSAIDLRYRLAGLQLRQLGNAEAALVQLRAVLRGDPDHAGAIAILESLLTDPSVQSAAAELLEPVYAGRQDWAALIRVGEIRLFGVEDMPHRLALTKRIARLYEEQLDDYDNALKWYGRVFQENPGERLNLEQLLRLAEKLDRWQDVGVLLSDYLAGAPDDSPAVLDVVRRAAEIFDFKLRNRESARHLYRRLFEARPGDREVAAWFEAALERWAEWTELRELLDEQAVLAANGEPDVERRAQLLRRSARIDEERLDDVDRALVTLREITEFHPDDRASPTASDEIERLLRAQSRWHDLADHLESEIGRAGGDAERDAVTMRLAEVLEEKIENPAGAVDRYAEILERSPAHKGAIAALERLLTAADSRARVAAVLEPVYRHSGDWSRLAIALEAQLETVDDREDRVRLLREIADIQQRLARVDSAFDTRARAWLVDVGNADTLAEIEALALSAKLYGPYVHTLQKGAALADDPDLQARLWAASAEVLERQLRDPGQAVEAWRQALIARPDDEESFVALERLLAEGGRVAELVEVLEQHLGFATAPGERKQIAKRIANLYDQALKQRDQAVAAWKTVTEIDDADMDALDALGRLHLAGMAWRDLAAVLQRKIELTSEPDSLRLMRLMGARLFEEKLSEPGEAVIQLRAILALAPNDAEALGQLDRILTQEGQHAELLEILDQRSVVEPDPAGRDAIAVRAATLLGDELSDVEGAVGRFRDILTRSPENADAQAALWRIARGHDFRESAVAVLEPLLRSAQDWPRLVETLELRLGVEDASPARLATLEEIARVEEVHRGDAAAAFLAWARALAEDPSATVARESLERLAASSGSWEALARVYEERLDNTFDSTLQRSFALRLGELHEGPLADLERSLSFYRKAAETPGDEGPVLAALERVLARLDRAGELAEVLQQQVELTSDPQSQTELLVRLGQLRVDRLDELESGLSALRQAIEKSPDDEPARAALRQLLERPEARDGALDVLEPLAESRGDYAELVSLYEYRLATRDEPSERAAGLRRIAALWEEQLGQPDRALAALGRALHDEPMMGQTVEALERVGATLGRPAATAAIIESAIAKADPTSARELSLRAAHLYESDPAAGPGERGTAERLYRAVLDDDPENLDALTALERFYRGSRDLNALGAILERRAEIELDPAERRRRLLEAARIHEDLGDVEGAVAALEKLREAEEGDVAVLDELARLREQQRKLPELCDVLAERARFENEASTRARLLARIGALRASELGDLEGAAEAYREALDSTPDAQGLLSALEAIEEKRENWSTLQEVLLRRLGAAGNADNADNADNAGSSGAAHEQIPVLFRLAKNAEERLSDIDQAVGFLHQALEIEPTHEAAFVALERILRASQRWYDLVDVLGKHAQIESDAHRRSEELALRVAIAEVWEKNLDSPDSATEALEKVLEIVPTQVDALLSLARIYESSGRLDDATTMLERAAGAVEGGTAAAEIHFRTAQIRRAQGAAEDELDAIYVRALEADPTHLPSLAALEAAARAKGDSDRVLQVLEVRLEATATPLERRPILSEIVKLHRDTFGNPAAATPFLQQLAALSPDDAAVTEELADALVASGQVDQAAGILERLADQFGKVRRGKDAARVLQRLGGIAERKGDAARAAERYTAAYKLDPGHPGTLAALGRLAMAAGDVDGARRYFRSLLLQTFDEKSAGISKAGVYLALGQIHLMAGETLKARNMFERGLESAPDNPELKRALATAPR